MISIDRRTLLASMAAWPLIAMSSLPAAGADARAIHKALIPGANVTVPGIGTARRHGKPTGEDQLAPTRETIARFAALSGTLIDTAPTYGHAEEVVGQLVVERGLRKKPFLATKAAADTREEGLTQIEESLRKLRTDKIDLSAVHNLRNLDQQLAILRDLQTANLVGAAGITRSFAGQHAEFEAVMLRHPLDSIQIDDAIAHRAATERILPLAQEKNIAVMINLPLGRDRLLNATRGRPSPEQAPEISATSWAQVFHKYVLSHQAGPTAIPGTAKVQYAQDNLGAAQELQPDAALRARMERYIDEL